MKRTFAFLVATFLTGLAMESLAQVPDTMWTHRYEISGSQTCWAAASTVDDGQVLVGTNAGNWLIIRVGANGEEVWQRIFDLGGDDRALDVVVGNDGDIYVSGTTYFSLMRLARLNAVDGDTVWTRAYDQQIARSLIQTPDGGFALGGVGH